MEIADPRGLRLNIQHAITRWVHGCDAGRAETRGAIARLNAAQGEHEGARHVDPICAECAMFHNIERADHFSRGGDFDPRAKACAAKRIVYEN